MARANTPTLLSLDRFAYLLGLSPVHFAGADGGNFFPITKVCKDVWPQYAWQSNRELISRDELGQGIADAERDLENILGFPLAPRWIVDDMLDWPIDLYGGRVPKRLQTKWGKLIAPGQRGLTLVEADATVTYSDPDGDTWNEMATVTASTTLTDAREIKLYFAGHLGDPAWEIRPLRSATISGGTFTATLDAWLLIDPDLWEAYPIPPGDYSPIDVSTTAAYVTEVDIYREFNDTTQPSATFLWEPHAHAFVCSTTDLGVPSEQTGHFGIVDARLGFVSPHIASYSDGAWHSEQAVVGRAPTAVKLSYYAGVVGSRYLARQNDDPLDDYLANAVMWLTIARLNRPICDCTNIKNEVRELQRDLTFSPADQGFYSRFQKQEIFNNPLGTRVGEVRAWQRIHHLVGEQLP